MPSTELPQSITKLAHSATFHCHGKDFILHESQLNIAERVPGRRKSKLRIKSDRFMVQGETLQTSDDLRSEG